MKNKLSFPLVWYSDVGTRLLLNFLRRGLLCTEKFQNLPI